MIRLLPNASVRSRIAMISTHGYVAARPPLGAADTGGQVVYVIQLARKLAQLGYAVDIWTRQFEKQPATESVSEHVRIRRVPCGGRAFVRKEDLWLHIPEWAENALHLIRKEALSYDFINSHYWDAGLAGELLASALNVPHVHTPHSLGLWKSQQMETDFPGNSAAFEKQYNFSHRIAEETRLYQTCHSIIATTGPQLSLLVDGYGIEANRISLIPPGYDDNRFYPVSGATRKNLRAELGYKGKVVLALGRLARNKGYDLLINGFAVAAKRIPDLQLRLAVGGEDLTPREKGLLRELRDRALATGVGDRIHFDSFISEEALADHYRAADLFVLSSRYEPFGMTAIEALACGTPALVTVHGGLHEALTFGRDALFADPFDAEDLGITLAKVFRHPQIAAMLSRNGAIQARAHYTWSGVAQQLIQSLAAPGEATTHFSPGSTAFAMSGGD